MPSKTLRRWCLDFLELFFMILIACAIFGLTSPQYSTSFEVHAFVHRFVELAVVKPGTGVSMAYDFVLAEQP